jgi:hypothetical protein
MSNVNPYLNSGWSSNTYFHCRGQSVLYYLTKPGDIQQNNDKLEILSNSYHYTTNAPRVVITRTYIIEITRLSTNEIRLRLTSVDSWNQMPDLTIKLPDGGNDWLYLGFTNTIYPLYHISESQYVFKHKLIFFAA